MNVDSNRRFRRSLSWAICAVTFLIPPLAWLLSSGDPLAYFTHHVPPGQFIFVASKLCALLALSLFWLQCMTALARLSPALEGFFQFTRRQHIVLGCTTFGFALLHLGLFVVASTLRTKHTAVDLLIPTFTKGFYRTNLSLGAMAFWLLVVAVVAGALRLRQGAAWKWSHRIVFAVFALGFLHGIAVGSETRFGLMKYVYVFIGLSMATALCSWMWHAFTVQRRMRYPVQQASRAASRTPSSPVDSLTE